MDAVKFLKELRRMCQNISCSDCSVQDICSRSISAPQWWEDDETKKAVETVEKWSAEHPRKTRLMDFLEKFPKASLNRDGLPFCLPRSFGYCGRETCFNCKRSRDAESCWDLPLEE